MSTNTPIETVEYYQDLLVAQYNGLPNASGTIAATVAPLIQPQISVQTLAFSPSPSGGSFTLVYNGTASTSIAWNASASTIQSALRTISALASVTVAGSIAAGLTVTFAGVIPPAFYLTVGANTTGATITIKETDQILPLAVQNAFNLVGSNIAVGIQLDIIAQYVGVTRTGQGFTTPITLDDADFFTLIQMGIVRNNAGSSLSDIVAFIYQFFGTNILVYDSTLMTLTYFISGSIGSNSLMQLFVTEGLIPKPMGVGLTVFYPVAAVFSFVTVLVPEEVNGYPFNTAQNYDLTWPWLDATEFIYP